MNTERLGLVLSGGGARGAFHVGVRERLREDPRLRERRLVLSGTSAGAINAAMIAVGRTPDEMMDFWTGIARDPPVEATDSFTASLIRVVAGLTLTEALDWTGTAKAGLFFLQRMLERFPPWPGRVIGAGIEYILTRRFDLVSRFIDTVEAPSLVDTAKLRARLVEALGGERVRPREHDLAISAVDVHRGRVVRYVSRRTPHTTSGEYVPCEDGIGVDIVLASASIPVLFSPAAVDGRRLWDGGLLVNTPLAPVVALGADEIVTVLVTELSTDRETFRRLGEALERAVDTLLENSYAVDRKLLLERNRLPGYKPVRLYKPIRPRGEPCFNVGAFLHFDPTLMAEMRVAGRAAAAVWLAPKSLPLDTLD